MLGELLVPCKVCGGSRLGAVSDRRRAAALGRDESSYRERWRGVYEWMLQRFSEAEQDAAYRFTMVLAQTQHEGMRCRARLDHG